MFHRMRNSHSFSPQSEVQTKFQTINHRNDERSPYVSASSLELGKLLNVAAIEGKHKEVSKLISIGATIHSYGPVGMSPLHLASMNGHLKICRTLLNSGIAIDGRDKVGKTALHFAAVNGHVEIVHHLLISGALVDANDMLDMTPLHWACDRGHYAVAKHLLLHEANPHILNKFQKSPSDVAWEKKYLDLVDLLKDGERKALSTRRSHGDKSILDSASDEFDSSSAHSSAEEEDLDCSEESEEDATHDLQHRLQPSVFSQQETPADEIEAITNQVQSNVLSDGGTPVSGTEDNDGDDDDDRDEEDVIQDKILKSLNALESITFKKNNSDVQLYDCVGEATELLRAQAALGTLEDPSRMLRRAINYGQTIQLTEAGERALAMIRPEPFIIPSKDRKGEEENDQCENTSVSQPGAQSAVVLHHTSIHDLVNELASCSSSSKANGPPLKRYKR